MIKCSAKSLVPTWHTFWGCRELNNFFEAALASFSNLTATCTLPAVTCSCASLYLHYSHVIP